MEVMARRQPTTKSNYGLNPRSWSVTRTTLRSGSMESTDDTHSLQKLHATHIPHKEWVLRNKIIRTVSASLVDWEHYYVGNHLPSLITWITHYPLVTLDYGILSRVIMWLHLSISQGIFRDCFTFFEKSKSPFEIQKLLLDMFDQFYENVYAN